MIEIDCKKTYANFTLNAKCDIQNGDFVAFFGKSGSGKTTLLRILAGFVKSDKGYMKNGEICYFDEKKFLPPQKRNIGFLFQDYALFPNMSVIKNLLFAKNDKALANELLELSDLKGLQNARISELSGGQAQRIALARALMRRPDILLLDEPFSALDSQIKAKLQDYVKDLHKKFKMTIILVSHDISEIYKLANQVFVIENGEIIKNGEPNEIFTKTSGSKKFSINAKILSITDADTIKLVRVSVGENINEIAFTPSEAKDLKIGDEVILSTKAFKMDITKVQK